MTTTACLYSNGDVLSHNAAKDFRIIGTPREHFRQSKGRRIPIYVLRELNVRPGTLKIVDQSDIEYRQGLEWKKRI